jgi:hypothetical protein
MSQWEGEGTRVGESDAGGEDRDGREGLILAQFFFLLQ